MGFGKKTDFETGRILDLDKSYRSLIKPAVEAAGLKCIRADEIVHSGLIDVPMYEQLLQADVVVADLSTSNKNAFYELGIRHALRPSTTIIVSEDGIKTFPFDINHVAVRQYHHLGDSIDYDEALRFQNMLRDAIKEIVAQNPISNDSPVYTFLQGLVPPVLKAIQQAAQAQAEELAAAVPEAPAEQEAGDMPGMGVAPPAAAPSPMPEAAPAPAAPDMTYSALMAEVDDAQGSGDWEAARDLLEVVRNRQRQARQRQRAAASVAPTQEMQEDPYILQRLALATYKAAAPDAAAPLLAARALLASQNPATSNDTETLGLWGAIHKRVWELAKRTAGPNPVAPEAWPALDESIRAYERGFYLKNDEYNGINFAYMLNVRAAEMLSSAEAIADFVQAKRVRQEVVDICNQWLATHAPAAGPTNAPSPEARQDLAAKRYWMLATKAEALLGMDDEGLANAVLQEAYALNPQAWMKATTETQFAKLRQLLEVNPLQFAARA